MDKAVFMRRAIALPREGVGGGPFGAMFVKDGLIVGECRTAMLPGHDPTARPNDRADAAAIGLDDAAIDGLARPNTDRALPLRRFRPEEALAGFRQWDARPDEVPY